MPGIQAQAYYDDGGEELYDVSNDPHQWTNLAARPNYTKVKQRLKEWLPKTNAPHFRGLER